MTLVKVKCLFDFTMRITRSVFAFCLLITVCFAIFGLFTPDESSASEIKDGELEIVRSQAIAFLETKKRLPELESLVNDKDWTFTRNLIHGPMQEVGREMLYINQRLIKTDRRKAESLSRKLKDALASLDEAARLQDPVRLNEAFVAVSSGFDNYSDFLPFEAIN